MLLPKGKTFEIIHMAGDVTTNNITINGSSNNFYEMGSETNLGSTLTINTTGEVVKLYASNNRWYVIR